MAKTKILKTLDFCAIDTETTGVDSKKDEIIEVAFVRFRSGVPVKMLHTLVCPKAGYVPGFITEITNIRTEDVLGKPHIEQIVQQAKRFLGNDVIVGQNPLFDIRFLEASGIGPITSPVVDTIRVAKKVYPDLPNYKLGTIIDRCASEGTPIWPGNAHRADWDAIMTGRGYVHMLPMLEA